MTPYITLKISNFVPQIIFHPEEGVTRKMTLKEESILDNMITAAKELNIAGDLKLNKDSETFNQLLLLARESDESYMEESKDINTESIEFNIEQLFKDLLSKSKEIENEYADVEMEEKIRAELNFNQNSDIFASILESLYLRIIAKTILAASELGIGEIHLDDESGNARLAEKMNKKFDEVGLTLIIE